MTVTVSFEAPQAQLGNGTTGIEISPIIIPYSIRNTEDPLQYLGGQVALTKEDGVAFSDNTADWYKKALVKIKNMVADAEMYAPEPIVEVPASSAADSVASSESTVANSAVEAPASSAEPVNSAVEAPVSSASAAELSEAPVSSSEPTVNTSVTESPVNSETEAQ